MGSSRQVATEPLEAEASGRINVLRLLLVIAVVLIHAKGHQESVGRTDFGPASLGAVAGFSQELISNVISRVAVPLFFLFSGLLTARSLAKDGYRTMLSKRGRTLLLPYLIWNVVVSIVYSFGSSASLQSWDPLAVLGVTSIPAAYHFWFVRDLIILVILSPGIVAVSARFPWAAALLGLALWFWAPSGLGVEGRPIDPAAICFFTIGAVFAHHPPSAPASAARVAAILFLPLAVADAIVPDTSPTGFSFHKAVILCGMIAAWHMGGLLSKRCPIPHWIACSGFMIYAAHEPLLTVLKKVAYFTLRPNGDLSVMAIYLVSVTATIAICICANHIAARVSPRFHALLTGGR